MKLYRFLSEDDTAAFCHKITAALNKGWQLHGGPSYAFDPLRGVTEEYRRLGILNYEMEAGTLFKMGLVYGFAAGCVCAVLAERLVVGSLCPGVGQGRLLEGLCLGPHGDVGLVGYAVVATLGRL